jgi:hypothetical protein
LTLTSTQTTPPAPLRKISCPAPRLADARSRLEARRRDRYGARLNPAVSGPSGTQGPGRIPTTHLLRIPETRRSGTKTPECPPPVKDPCRILGNPSAPTPAGARTGRVSSIRLIPDAAAARVWAKARSKTRGASPSHKPAASCGRDREPARTTPRAAAPQNLDTGAAVWSR